FRRCEPQLLPGSVLPSAAFGTAGIGAVGFSGITFGSGTLVERSGGATRGNGGSWVLLHAMVSTTDASSATSSEIGCFIEAPPARETPVMRALGREKKRPAGSSRPRGAAHPPQGITETQVRF